MVTSFMLFSWNKENLLLKLLSTNELVPQIKLHPKSCQYLLQITLNQTTLFSSQLIWVMSISTVNWQLPQCSILEYELNMSFNTSLPSSYQRVALEDHAVLQHGMIYKILLSDKDTDTISSMLNPIRNNKISMKLTKQI